MGDVQLATSTQITKTSLTLGRGSLRSDPPAFTLPPRNVRVSQGGTARLEGTVKGCPEPQVIWYRDGKPLTPGEHHTMEQGPRGAFSLVVHGVREEDGGRYTCEALNDGGSRQITVTLTVEGNGEKRFNLPSASRTAGGRVPAVENRPSIWGESPPKFVTKPSRLFLNVGQSGKFSAKITGRPQPQVVWLKGEMELQPGGRFNMFERSGVHFLEVSDARAEDAGTYTCSVMNNAGKAMATAELTIQGADQLNADQPIDMRFILLHKNNHPNKSTKLPSEIRVDAPSWAAISQRRADPERPHSGQPAAPGGESVRPCGPSPLSAKEPTYPEPKTGSGKFLREDRFEVMGSPPQFDLQPQSQEVLEGATVTFCCQVSGSPAPTLSWIKDGLVLRGGPGMKIQQEASLHLLCLERVCKEDAGSYGCAASNSRGQASATWALVVKSPHLEGTAPVFSSVLEDRVVSEGQGFILRCSVQGRPPPRVTWLLNDQPVPQSRCSYEGGEAQLEVQAAVREDGGSYTCVAENTHGRTACNARVLPFASQIRKAKATRVGEAKKPLAPAFVRGLEDLKVMDGSRVTMTVEVTGYPQPRVGWLHNGEEVQESEDFHFERRGNEHSLVIQEVFPEDTGKYTCEAWNELGGAHTEAILTVQEPQDGVQPWFISKPKSTTATLGQHALLSCAIAGDPFPQFLWKKDGQELSSGGDFEILQKEDVVSLLIRRVKTHHAGEYEIILKYGPFICTFSSMFLRLCDVETTMHPVVHETTLEFVQQHVWRHYYPGHDRDAKGLLQRRVETRQRGEEHIRQQEAEQRDFRAVLARSVNTKSLTEEDLKEIAAEQMDFRANLQRQVKPKTLSEEERKISAPQQVDFRSVLGKKGGGGSPKIGADKGEPPKNASADFRAVLGNKKKPPVPAPVENNVESPAPKGPAPEEKPEKEVNCVDGGINGRKSGDTGKAPEFTQKLRDVTVLDGDLLRLECEVSAEPPATITWMLDGKVVKPSKFILLSQEGGRCSLTIDKALPEDEGQYKCRAENAVGRAECECMVLVDDPTDINATAADKKMKKSTPTTESESQICTLLLPGVPPQIIQFPEDMKILAGQEVNLLCKFAGAPPITCTWLKFRKPIPGGKGDITIDTGESSSQLIISPAKPDHCGCYTIELQNKFGTRQASLNLTIVDKPDPPARVPAASDIRQSSLTLSWYGPTYDGGSVVKSYNLEIWNSVDQEWKPLASCNSTSYNVQDLLADRQYKFRVRAVNIYGIGEPSAESDPVTVGVQEEGEQEEEAEASDEGMNEKQEYRDVVIKTDQTVKDFYDVQERLGTGKFGQVFKLVEKATKKVWAGKFIKAFSAKDKESVRQEIGIMNCLHHAKLVQCVDAFEGKSDIVMVMEMISGGELFERIIDEDFELTEREVIKYMLQIVDGVQFIHKQGIVHLDLKPENIMCINKTGTKIKLIDFGLARRLENSGSLKVLFGTPEFVAPEVINYEPIGYPTDMWSIGVICYILVSGLSPFMGDNDNETLSNVTSASWDFEDEAFDEISEEAKDFISQLLKKNLK
uniref:Myosin light chain kinase, smooth muscle n=1 Tax=Scleropages formosus TaxID=113540 RepID=A0A8C9WE76_SCLFO